MDDTGIIVGTGEATKAPLGADLPTLISLVKAVVPFFVSRSEDELRMRKLALEVEVLERQLGGQAAALVPFDVGLRGMNKINLVVGSQHSGKSWLLARAAEFALSMGSPVYWWEPRFVEKESRPDGVGGWVPGQRVEPGSVVVIDEAWKLYETGEVKGDQWLRSLYHSNVTVWMGVQSGGFVSPRVWKAGAIAVFCTGSDGVGHRFEREEVADIMATLANHAIPRKVISAFSNGCFYVFETD